MLYKLVWTYVTEKSVFPGEISWRVVCLSGRYARQGARKLRIWNHVTKLKKTFNKIEGKEQGGIFRMWHE